MAWWRARAGTVWSDYGGRGRHVALRWKGMGSPAQTVIGGLVGALGLVFSVSGIWSLYRLESDVPWWLFAVFGCMLTTSLVGVGLLVWAAPDLVRRCTIEGSVIVRERHPYREDGTGAIRGYGYYVAVDDGLSDRATLYNFGPSRRSRLGQRMYHEILEGDLVRLTVTPHFGRVVRFEVLADRTGHPLPPPGLPAATPPQAPATVTHVEQTTRLTVRHVDSATVTAGKVTIETWTYHLVGDRDAQVGIYVAYGEGCYEATLTHLRLPPQPRHPAPEAGITAHRYGPSATLVVSGPTTIAVAATGQWNPPRYWDTTLANHTLHHLPQRHPPS